MLQGQQPEMQLARDLSQSYHCQALFCERQKAAACLILVEGRKQADPHQQLEAWAQALPWPVVVAAVLLPANEIGRLCLVHNDLQLRIDLFQGLYRAHIVQVGVSHCTQEL